MKAPPIEQSIPILNFDDLTCILDLYEKDPSAVDSSQKFIVNFCVIRDILQIFYLVKFLRREIANAGEHLQNKHITHAHNQLDAIVQSTADATHQILDNAENILTILTSSNCEKTTQSVLDQINKHTTKIFEACSFQDITGQRISRVIKILKIIEERLENLSRTFGMNDAVATPILTDQEIEESLSNESLMFGPQLPGFEQDQGSIDSLLTKVMD